VLPAYCTNVVAGRTLEESCTSVGRTFGAVRDAVVPRGRLPIGLWLSARAATQLEESVEGAAGMRERLGAHGLDVVTLNGFPYHDFRQPVVKHAVYEPHWADVRRLLHTQRLADLLPDLLPEGTRTASISTLPLGWRARFSLEGCGASVGLAGAMLEQLVAHLARVEERTGVRVTVDLEPEPGCMLDRPQDAVGFLLHALRARPGMPDPRRYVGICHDTCHAAVMFDGQRDALRAYREAGIRVHKVQLSSAIACDGSPEALAVLAAYAEPRWLHQTCVRAADGSVRFWEDIPFALAAEPVGEWRTHFHVPLFAARLGALGTTQAAVEECMSEIASWPADERPAFEAETYAWDVLPRDASPAEALEDGIAAELRWAAERLRAHGLAGVPA
jgi:sugar phosphate isomerase/epimerase